jgi:intracellular septation protein A
MRRVRERRIRPLGIAVIVLFELVNMSIFLLAVWGIGPRVGEGTIYEVSATSDAARIALTAVALIGIVAAIGLWFLSRRAWVVTMVLIGIMLVFGLWSWAIGEPSFVRILINAVIALYLNQPAVQRAVGRDMPVAQPA